MPASLGRAVICVAATAALGSAAIPALRVSTAAAAAADTATPSSLTLSTTLRDFEYTGSPVHSTATNPDFQHYAAGVQPGLVDPTLGADGTPVLESTGLPQEITSATSFAQWFHDVPGTNATVNEPLTLAQVSSGVYKYSSTAYYPLDGKGWNDPSYGPDAQVNDDCSGTRGHNFSFTQEIHTRFTYQGSPTFSVTGDDDVWLFVNGHLVIDLGGVHAYATGTVTLTSATAASLGLTPGGSYSFDLFKAERHTCDSTFSLTLSGGVAGAPVVTIEGVSAGTTYEYGQVPAATCSASGIDGTTQVNPTLSAPTGGDGTGQQTASCSFTDSSGQTTTAAVTYTISDTGPPMITLGAPSTVSAAGPQTAVVVRASALDLLDGPVPVSCTLDGGAQVPIGENDLMTVGPHTIDCTGSDSHGNTGTAHATVTVVDATAPVLPALPNYAPAFGADGTVAATYPAPADASDLVDGPVPVRCTPTSGDVVLTARNGSVVVTCMATDHAGNTASGQFTITGHDADAPTLTVPASMTAEASGPDGTVVTYPTPTATDNVDGTRPVDCDHLSHSLFPLGATTVRCTSSDAAGNSAQAWFTVTVQDTTPPVLTGHLPATIEATGPLTPVDVSVSAADAVDGPLPVRCLTDPADGTSVYTGQGVGVGPLTLSCTATDRHGNTGVLILATRVVDTTPPTVVAPGPMTVEATGPAGVLASAVTLAPADAGDLVSGPLPASCTPHLDGDHYLMGANEVICSAVDDAGNVGSASYTVTVVDTTAPAFAPTRDIAAAGPATGTAVNYEAPVATDAVDGVVPVTCNPASGSTFPQATTTVTCRASDSRGNAATTSFTVTVADQDPPLVTVPANRTAEAAGPDGAMLTYPPATALDAVDGPRPTACSPSSGSTFPLGRTTVTCTATDASGNVGAASFTVTVADTTAPRIVTPAPLTATAGSSRGATVSYSAPSATDAVDGTDPVTCTIPAGSATETVDPGATFPPGATTVTCTSTDRAGNTGSATFTVAITYGFGGFSAPVTDGVFKLGSTVPVKFALDGASATIADAPAKLYLLRLSGATTVGATQTATSTSTATTGNRFRYVGGQYLFNLATAGLSAGTWQVRLELGDGIPRTVTMTLR